MQNKLIVYVLLGFFLASCDPLQTIEIENKSNDASTIKFFFNGDDYHKFNGFLKKDSLVLGLNAGDTKKFSFGIGTWEVNNSLDSLAIRVQKIEIETKKSTKLFDTDAQVKSFFSDRLIDDRYRARILIEIE